MKPVNYSWGPTYAVGSHKEITAINTQHHPSGGSSFNTAIPDSYNFSRRRAPMLKFGYYEQAVDYNPNSLPPSTEFNAATPLYGVDVATRPGSWTPGFFPGLTAYVRIKVRFYRRKTKVLDATYFNEPRNLINQMAYGTSMYGY